MPAMPRPTRLLAALALAATAVVVTATGVSSPAADGAPSDLGELVEPAECCERAVRTTEFPPVREVVLIGDSLSVGVTDPRYIVGPTFQEALTAAGISNTTSTSVGLTVPLARGAVGRGETGIGASTDVVVIALGTNDVFNTGGTEADRWRAAQDLLLEAIRAAAPGARIVWVDVSFLRFQSRADVFNAVLGQQQTDGAIEVCPWHALIRAHPEWLGSDQLHLTGTGYAARRDLIVDCVLLR